MAIQQPDNLSDITGNPVPELDLDTQQAQPQQSFLSADQLQNRGYAVQQASTPVEADGGRTTTQSSPVFTAQRDGADLGSFAGGNAQVNLNRAAQFVRQEAGPTAVANLSRQRERATGDLARGNFAANQQYKVTTVTGPASDGTGDTIQLRKDVFNLGTGELAASFWNQEPSGDATQLNNNLQQWLTQNRIGTTSDLAGGESAEPLAGVVQFDTTESAPIAPGQFTAEAQAPLVQNPVGFGTQALAAPPALTNINRGTNTAVINTTGTPALAAPTGTARLINTAVSNTTGNPVTTALRAVANTVRTVTDNITGTPVPVTRPPVANPLASTIQTAFASDPTVNASLFNEIARNLNVAANSVTGQQAVRRFLSNNGLNLNDTQFTAFRSGTALPAAAQAFNITGPINNVPGAVTSDANILRALNLTAPPPATAPRTAAGTAASPFRTTLFAPPARPVSTAPLQDIPGTPITDPTDPTEINNAARPVSDFDFGFGADEDIGPISRGPGAQDIPFEETGDDFLDPNDINFGADDVTDDPLALDDDTEDLFNDPFFDDEDLVDEQEAGFTRGLTINAQNQIAINSQQGVQANFDWRVKLQLAPGADYLYMDPDEQSNTSGILYPLSVTNGVIFPYTPAIQTNYIANYSDYNLTHSNLRGLFYQSSYVDDISITCPFTAQDTEEANYLLAVIHFFRSVTKMFYGQDAQRGVPPPLVYLTGLGEFQFNGHPCVVSSFTYSLPADVDYIRARTSTIQGGVDLLYKRSRQDLPVNASQSSRQRLQTAGLNPGAQQPRRAAPPSLGVGTPTYVPTKMEIQIGLKPVQSRAQVSQEFSLKEYSNGSLLRRGFW